MTYTNDYSHRIEQLRQLMAEADHVLIGAGAGLSTAAGLDYAGEDFRREFSEWIDRYGITDLYSAGFYPFETDEERWALWAKHIWFCRYRIGALPLYEELLRLVDGRDYFVITTNVDGQFEKAGFDPQRVFATQGDYALFQPASGYPKQTYRNQDWVERALPAINDCRIPTEMIPHTPDGQPVSTNLRCDDTFVEDVHWHEQARRYSDFLQEAHSERLLLLEFGVGFNTPVIIRYPFEQLAARFPNIALVRFNTDHPQLHTQGVSRFVAFQEEVAQVLRSLSIERHTTQSSSCKEWNAL